MDLLRTTSPFPVVLPRAVGTVAAPGPVQEARAAAAVRKRRGNHDHPGDGGQVTAENHEERVEPPQ